MRAQTIRITNTARTKLSLWIEPWGDCVQLDPQEWVDVIFTGPVGGNLEVDHGEEKMIVYGWAGTVVKVTRGDETLIEY